MGRTRFVQTDGRCKLHFLLATFILHNTNYANYWWLVWQQTSCADRYRPDAALPRGTALPYMFISLFDTSPYFSIACEAVMLTMRNNPWFPLQPRSRRRSILRMLAHNVRLTLPDLSWQNAIPR